MACSFPSQFFLWGRWAVRGESVERKFVKMIKSPMKKEADTVPGESKQSCPESFSMAAREGEN